MGYHVIDPASLPATPEYPCDRRSLDGAAGLAALHAGVYTLAPGESLARAYHSHPQREELFYVLDGTLTVETPDGPHTVATDEVFVAEPENPIDPHNPADATGPVRVLAAGAPKADPAVPYEPDAAGPDAPNGSAGPDAPTESTGPDAPTESAGPDETP